MAPNNTIKIQNINNSDEAAQTVDVLYQKMGDRWYAFSLVGDEVFMGSVSQEEINRAADEDVAIEKIIVEAPEAFNEVA